MVLDAEAIRKQAKGILESFAKALEKVSVKEASVEREQDRRKENEGNAGDSEFRKIMLENAPEKDDDCIKAEKGSWIWQH